ECAPQGALRILAHVVFQLEVKWINSEQLEDDMREDPEGALWRAFGDVRGIVVPGGFGSRGIEGKIHAIRFAREQRVPFLGLCLGMQCAVIEFARHVLGTAAVNSAEFDPQVEHPVIDYMADQSANGAKGGTMRLGLYPCQLLPGTKAREAYVVDEVRERHR